MDTKDLEMTIVAFDVKADGSPYWIGVYLRSGHRVAGAVHAYTRQNMVWLDVSNTAGDTRLMSISVESIDAVHFMPEGEE